MADKNNDAHEQAVEKAREQIRAELIEKQEAKDAASGKPSGKSGGKSKSGFSAGALIIGIIVGLIVGAVGMYLIGSKTNLFFSGTHTTVATADGVLNQGPLGTFTAADFKDAILGEATKQQELVVMEQELEIPTTISKAGLGNLAIFSKVQNISYHGTGVYTVDLALINKDSIEVDMEKKKVVVYVPRTCLQYINPNLDETEFEDTERGLLAFGDIKLTPEEQNSLLQSVIENMRERLTKSDLYKHADDFAQVSLWKTFQPLVNNVSPEFDLEIEFDKDSENMDKTVE